MIQKRQSVDGSDRRQDLRQLLLADVTADVNRRRQVGRIGDAVDLR